MTGQTKYPVLDEAFLPKMIEQCADDEERGLVYILYYTGMHGSCLTVLTEQNIIREGKRFFLEWKRPKTHKTTRCLLPPEKVTTVILFCKGRKKTLHGYNFKLKKIGKKAGFEGISTMTFRHTRCIRALRDEGYSLWQVPHVMNCTLDVVARNYSKLREDQLIHDSDKIE